MQNYLYRLFSRAFLAPVILLFLVTDNGFGQNRIICLHGAITETVAALGFGKNIVATDVTSEYPAFVKNLPKVSRNRQVSPESILAFTPDLVLAMEKDITREMRFQFKAAGIRLVGIKQQFSPQGATDFIRDIGAALGTVPKAETLARQTASDIQKAQSTIKQAGHKAAKVLFIYARGAGAMTVSGRGSSMDAIIHLAGAANAVKEFADYKAYSTEMLVKTNPDVILMFDFGASSLGGTAGILSLPGIASTNAGKNKRIILMDGPLLTGFGARLPQAMLALHHKIYP